MKKIAVIGVGNWGKNHARILSTNPRVQLAGLCDADKEKILHLKSLYSSINCTGRLESIAVDQDIEAVIIATSAYTHYDIARLMLENGKDVFIEKPMTLSAKEAAILIELADKNNRLIMVGHLLMYHPAVEYIKNYIDAGQLGEILYITSQRVNLGVIRRDENVLWSLGPHDISIISYLLNEQPSDIISTGSNFIQKDIEDVVFVHLKFPSGKIASIHLSWLDPHKLRKMTIVGTKTMIVFDDMESNEKVKIYDKGVKPQNYDSYGELIGLRFGDILIPHIENKEPLKSELDHFIDCIDSRETPRSDGKNGLNVIKILEEADNSLKTGK